MQLSMEEAEHVAKVYAAISSIMVREFSEDPNGFYKGISALIAILSSLFVSNKMPPEIRKMFLDEFAKNVLEYTRNLQEDLENQ